MIFLSLLGNRLLQTRVFKTRWGRGFEASKVSIIMIFKRAAREEKRKSLRKNEL